jgi:endonuclease YncB( thermonuclease family)
MIRFTMSKVAWVSSSMAAVLLAGGLGAEPMPQHPYDLPRTDEKAVADVNLVGAILGYSIDARMPDDNAALTIYLADIMAPARGQPWHAESIAALDRLVKGKLARVRFLEEVYVPEDLVQEYGVVVRGRVFVDGRDLSWELVGSGNAWVWEAKSNDPELKKLQEWARMHKKGFWALPEADREPPWSFMDRILRQRMQQREESRTSR